MYPIHQVEILALPPEPRLVTLCSSQGGDSSSLSQIFAVVIEMGPVIASRDTSAVDPLGEGDIGLSEEV